LKLKKWTFYRVYTWFFHSKMWTDHDETYMVWGRTCSTRCLTGFDKHIHIWPLDDLWPHPCWGHMCASIQRSLCTTPIEIHQGMCRGHHFESMTPRWHFTPPLLGSHVYLYPRITVFNSHWNPSKYMDTVTNYVKVNIEKLRQCTANRAHFVVPIRKFFRRGQ
jgi:hypothetical protein